MTHSSWCNLWISWGMGANWVVLCHGPSFVCCFTWSQQHWKNFRSRHGRFGMIRFSETWRFLGLKESFLAEWLVFQGRTVSFREYSKQADIDSNTCFYTIIFSGYPKSKVLVIQIDLETMTIYTTLAFRVKNMSWFENPSFPCDRFNEPPPGRNETWGRRANRLSLSWRFSPETWASMKRAGTTEWFNRWPKWWFKVINCSSFFATKNGIVNTWYIWIYPHTGCGWPILGLCSDSLIQMQ